MIKILIQIKDNNIYFKAKRNLNEEQKNILNTNIISDNELIFTDEYIFQNLKIVTNFINELITDAVIDTAIIYNNKVVYQILEILKNTKSITNLILKDDVPITFKMCEKITETNIKLLSCYNLQDFMVDYLDNANIRIESRCEMFFISSFMQNNSLNKYSSIYYKKSIHLTLPISENDIDDLNAFCKINKYLKTIHVNKAIKSDLEEIINIINMYKLKNIKIVLHENVNNIELVEYIKRINKSSKKKNNIKITVSYSDEYLYKNFLPQTNIGILRAMLFIILIIVLGSFLYVFINNYVAYQKDEEFKSGFKEIISSTDTEIIVEELEKNSSKKIVNEYIASLMTYNSDTIAWLTVNNTGIDYPIVQTDNNEYYLNHNIANKNDLNGWIFMDYRNDEDLINDNTVFYGHTRYNSNVMFGTLTNIENKEWRSNEENLTISLDTLYESNKYKIFSYYTIGITNDYLKYQFTNDIEKYEFLNMLKNRSIYDFDTEIHSDDKIITLSTCEDGGSKRLVVHAVLID